MSRMLYFIALPILFFNISCEKCKKCTYSYTETVIVETVDGEIEKVIQHKDLILKDSQGLPFGSECLKGRDYKDENSFTIVNYYELQAAKSELDNFKVKCIDL